MDISKRTFFEITGELFVLGYSEEGKYIQNNASEAGYYPVSIGDVTQPLPKACIEAMHKAVEELASKDTFRGYVLSRGTIF